MGDSSVFATLTGPASDIDTEDCLTALVVNMTNAARRFGLCVFNSERLIRVDTYCIDPTYATPFLAVSDRLTKDRRTPYVVPLMSTTLLVFNQQ